MKGKLFVITAPSGAGKTSLIEAVMRDDPTLVISVSYTTRAPRDGERDGVDYHFVDGPTFEAMQRRGEFLESAEVHGNRYGTSRKWIADARALPVDLEDDVEAAPALAELERRLRKRGQDNEEAIARRLANAREEMAHAAEFEYVIINKDFEEAKRDLSAIVRASRLSAERQRARHPEAFQRPD